MKASHISITESLRSFRGPSATFLSEGQTEPKSIFKLISLSYRATYIYEVDKTQT